MISPSPPTFFRKRITELAGIALVLLGVFLGLAFITYSPNDPSFDLATGGHARNFMGRAGAYVASPLLQFFGFACFVLSTAPLAWGIRILAKKPLKFLWLKFIMLMTALVSFAAVFAVFGAKENLPLQSYGGYIGYFLKEKLYHFNPSAFSVIAMVLGLLTLFFALGISFYGWLEGTIVVAKIISFVSRISYRMFQKIYALLGKKSLSPQPELGLNLRRRKKKEAPERKMPRISPYLKRVAEPEGRQDSFDLPLPNNFTLPSLNLLSDPPKIRKSGLSESALQQNARLLERVLEDFGVYGKIIGINPGPVVTLYELEPAAGTKSSRVIGLADDIARSMSATSARIAVIPGKNAIGIELPNSTRETVYLRELLETAEYQSAESKLAIALGKNIGGDPVIVDLAKMPHLLVAGTTGSGKSVAINTMILSLLYKYSPDECKFIMIDPKMLELSVYDGIPHLLAAVVTDPKKAVVGLKWTVKEMENRYRLMSTLGVRNIAGYNSRIEAALKEGEVLTRTVQTGFDVETGKPTLETVPLNMAPLPFIVVIVDEMADLMLVAGKEIETSVQRLAQMARAAGIHIIMATQRPSVDVITGVIKANLPTRISFQVTSRIDSRTILGEQGGEQLLGAGDMLYMSGGSRIIRVHGPFVSDEEVEEVVSFLKTQGAPVYMDDITADESEDAAFEGSSAGERDELYDQAVALVLNERKASTSFVQRYLKIGYNRAATIIERMEKEGVVSPANHVGKREVLLEA